MSDQPQGPEWWLASDGRWYPPDQAPAVPPPETWATVPPGPPPRPAMSSGGKVALALTAVVGLLVLLIAAVTVLGSESDSPSSGDQPADRDERSAPDPADLPEGYAQLEGDGVSIAAPEGWELIDAEDAAMGSEELAEAFPGVAPGVVEQGMDVFEQGAVLVAFDFTGGAFASNVNIIEIPAEAPFAEIEGEAVRQLGALGGSVVDSGVVDVPAGESLRIEYTLSVQLPDGSSLPTEGVQHYVSVDGRTFIITVSAGDGAAALADAMVDTFRAG